MRGINKLAAVLCLLMLPNTVFAEQTDRPQHPKTAVSSTPHDTPQNTPANKISVSASPTKTNIPTDVKIVSDLGNDFSKSPILNMFGYNKADSYFKSYYNIYYPHNHFYVMLGTEKTTAKFWFGEQIVTIFTIGIYNNTDVVLKRKKSPYLITIKQGSIQKKQMPKNDSFSTNHVSYKLSQKFFADAVDADETYIELDGADNNKIWVKIPQDVVAQFNKVFETDMKKKIKEYE